MHTQAVEDYLKAIYEIQHKHDKVATTMLARWLGVTPASVTGMIKKLADMQLVAYEPYQGVVLTDAGLKIALEVIRHHRLIERFLTETLGLSWDRVHEEAHKIEHVLSEELEERMDALLGYPTTDPHGAPIPTQDGEVTERDSTRLTDLEPGQSALITEVSDHDSVLLRYLGRLGLYPSTRVSVVAVEPFDGPIIVRVGEVEHALGRPAADHVLVTEIEVSPT